MTAHWRTIIGPLVTALTIGLIVLLQQQAVSIPNPAVIYFCVIVFATYVGGWISGAVSAAITLGYAFVFFSTPGQLFKFTPDNVARLLVLCTTTPIIVILTGVLKERSTRAIRRARKATAGLAQQNEALQLMRTALDKSNDGIVLLDRELRAEFINRAFRKIWNLPDGIADSKPAFVGLMYHGRNTHAYEVPDSQLDDYISERVAQIRDGNEIVRDIRLSDGSVYRLESTTLTDGRRMLTYTNLTDIVRHSDELETLRSALDHVENGIMLLDADLRIMFTNRALRTLMKLPEHTVETKPAFDEMLLGFRGSGVWDVPLDNWDTYCSERIAMIRRGDPTPRDLRRADGCIIRSRCFTLPDGGRMLTYYDITEVVTHADKLERLAMVDGLTGISNRRHFLENAGAEWSRYQRYNRPLSLLMIDIDHFKSINDRFGHDAGDKALTHVAALCCEDNRASDVAARLGGEEFGLLLPETELDLAFLVAERLRLKVESAPLQVDGLTIPLTVSIGVATALPAMGHFQALMKTADAALYEAKRSGRNCVVGSKSGAGDKNAHAAA
jgi:diguanylate cyclase (GGDEF)-like protein